MSIFDETLTMNNGLKISKMVLEVWKIPDDQTPKAVEEAIKIGYRHIDTVQAYGNERGVGEGVRNSEIARDKIFINSKVAAEIKDYKKTKASIDETLEKMGLNYLDMMIIHNSQLWSEVNQSTDRHFEGNLETWRAMEDAVKEDLDNLMQNSSTNLLLIKFQFTFFLARFQQKEQYFYYRLLKIEGKLMLKNIIFDFGNVIMNYNPDEILNHYELSPEDHDLIRKTIFESKEWGEIDSGKITEEEATEIFISKVPDKLKSKVKQIMATWPENVDFYEPVFNYMEELRKQGYKIYGLSNTGMQFANFVKNSEMGNYFDGYVFSAQEKLMKPDRRIYERLIARYILNPEESIFIDDLKANTDAAKKLGMLAFTFKIDKLGELQEYISNH